MAIIEFVVKFGDRINLSFDFNILASMDVNAEVRKLYL